MSGVGAPSRPIAISGAPLRSERSLSKRLLDADKGTGGLFGASAPVAIAPSSPVVGSLSTSHVKASRLAEISLPGSSVPRSITVARSMVGRGGVGVGVRGMVGSGGGGGRHGAGSLSFRAVPAWTGSGLVERGGDETSGSESEEEEEESSSDSEPDLAVGATAAISIPVVGTPSTGRSIAPTSPITTSNTTTPTVPSTGTTLSSPTAPLSHPPSVASPTDVDTTTPTSATPPAPPHPTSDLSPATPEEVERRRRTAASLFASYDLIDPKTFAFWSAPDFACLAARLPGEDAIMKMSLSATRTALFQLHESGTLVKRGFKWRRRWVTRWVTLHGRVLRYFSLSEREMPSADDAPSTLDGRSVITGKHVMPRTAVLPSSTTRAASTSFGQDTASETGSLGSADDPLAGIAGTSSFSSTSASHSSGVVSPGETGVVDAELDRSHTPIAVSMDASPRGMMELTADTEVRNLNDRHDHPWRFSVKSPAEPKRVWYLEADSEQDRARWVRALVRAIALIKRSQSLELLPNQGNLTDHYHVGGVIKTFSTGVVRLVKHKRTGAVLCAREITKEKVLGSKTARQRLLVLKHASMIVKNRSLARCNEMYESSTLLHMLYNPFQGQPLLDHLAQRYNRTSYGEGVVAGIVAQVASALQALHSRGIVHRNVTHGNLRAIAPDTLDAATQSFPTVVLASHDTARVSLKMAQRHARRAASSSGSGGGGGGSGGGSQGPHRRSSSGTSIKTSGTSTPDSLRLKAVDLMLRSPPRAGSGGVGGGDDFDSEDIVRHVLMTLLQPDEPMSDLKPDPELGVNPVTDLDPAVVALPPFTLVGSVPPESFKTPNAASTDIWSLGVLMYTLLMGYPPPRQFGSQPTVLGQLRSGAMIWHTHHWAPVSHDAKHLLSKLLQPDPASRLGAREVLQHPWIRSQVNLTRIPSVMTEEEAWAPPVSPPPALSSAVDPSLAPPPSPPRDAKPLPTSFDRLVTTSQEVTARIIAAGAPPPSPFRL